MSFFGAGKSILLRKKTIPKTMIEAIINFIISPTKFRVELVFLINCI